MTKETLEAASKILGVLLDELAVPPEFVERARRAADRILAEVERSGLAAVLARTAGPTISDELLWHSQRSTMNIAQIAALVVSLGVHPDRVRTLVRGHIYDQTVQEQELIQAILALPALTARTREDGLH